MTESIERFLRRRPAISIDAPLGRVFNVLCETWRLDDDPKRTPPDVEFLATGRSAAEAADLAREAAARFRRHGFDKGSRAWWAVDGEHFHRIMVASRRRRPIGLALGLGALGLAAVWVAGRGARRRGPDGDDQ